MKSYKMELIIAMSLIIIGIYLIGAGCLWIYNIEPNTNYPEIEKAQKYAQSNNP